MSFQSFPDGERRFQLAAHVSITAWQSNMCITRSRTSSCHRSHLAAILLHSDRHCTDVFAHLKYSIPNMPEMIQLVEAQMSFKMASSFTDFTGKIQECFFDRMQHSFKNI